MKYSSKQALITDIESQRAALIALLERVPHEDYHAPGVWGDGWTVADLVTHLTAWHEFCLEWYLAGSQGRQVEMPAPGFNWSETPKLNREIQTRYCGAPPHASLDWFNTSHRKLVDLAASLTEDQLMMPGQYAWTGRNALVIYVAANTASHYRFAQKVLRRWLRRHVARETS